ncbi:MAG: hypothetical protein JHC33_04085 [Ignisphaera sp.]|nr:hypothetical protein [Ignisphaera sp.]
MRKVAEEDAHLIFKELFRKYYRVADLILPQDLGFREIALQDFDGGYYIRHLTFENKSQLIEFITREHVPKDLYYSSARYRDPGNSSMEGKGWIGSDLIFDIDADELPSCSSKIVELRFCPQCGYIATNPNEKTCPRCNKELVKFRHVEPECISMAFDCLKKLVDIIENDFGFTNYRANFSGNRGFHLIVELQHPYDLLDSEMRREIVSYLVLDDVQKKFIKNMYVTELSGKGRKGLLSIIPRIVDGGIRRRIAKALLEKVPEYSKSYILGYVNEIDAAKAVEIVNILRNNLDEILNMISIPIDAKVTIDLTHLVRVPNSINGKTGWRAYLIDDLSEFRLDESKASIGNISETFRIKFIVSLPEIRVVDRAFKVKQDDILDLEYVYASYFIFKGVAKLIDVKR